MITVDEATGRLIFTTSDLTPFGGCSHRDTIQAHFKFGIRSNDDTPDQEPGYYTGGSLLVCAHCGAQKWFHLGWTPLVTSATFPALEVTPKQAAQLFNTLATAYAAIQLMTEAPAAQRRTRAAEMSAQIIETLESVILGNDYDLSKL